MSLTDLLGYIGVALVIVTTVMMTMIPLRALSMLCNAIFIGIGYTSHVYSSVLLQFILLLINGYRLWEMVQLTRRVKAASGGDETMDWLKPFMSRRRYRKGEVVFAKGALADEMIYTVSGRLRLVELDTEVLPGEVLGELGLLAPGRRPSVFIPRSRPRAVQCAGAVGGDGGPLLVGRLGLIGFD